MRQGINSTDEQTIRKLKNQINGDEKKQKRMKGRKEKEENNKYSHRKVSLDAVFASLTVK